MLSSRERVRSSRGWEPFLPLQREVGDSFKGTDKGSCLGGSFKGLFKASFKDSFIGILEGTLKGTLNYRDPSSLTVQDLVFRVSGLGFLG